MKSLLDTHIFLWYITDDPRLRKSWRTAIQDTNNQVYLSVVSFWEIMVKYHLGKLDLPEPPALYIPTQRLRHQIADLSLDEQSVAQLAKLPWLHRDPFDRMLMGQAIAHKLILFTADETIRAYQVSDLTFSNQDD